VPPWARDASKQAQFVVRAAAEFGRALAAGPVLDVAGGDGHVACLLSTIAGADATLIDPNARPDEAAAYAAARNARPFRVRRESFAAGDARRCACVLGFRPCQATEPIVDFAVRTRTPFMLLPCCAHPVAGVDVRGDLGDMLERLQAKDPQIRRGALPGATTKPNADTDLLYATFDDG